MKKEDAKKVLEFLEYVGKNMAVRDENFEYHTHALFDCKCILEDEVNDAETSHDQALNLAVVSGSASNPVVNEKNSPYCTYTRDCYQTIACRVGGKKLCKHRLQNID